MLMPRNARSGKLSRLRRWMALLMLRKCADLCICIRNTLRMYESIAKAWGLKSPSV
mgnify:CR=1 FL=1